jgi:hypothetical protein
MLSELQFSVSLASHAENRPIADQSGLSSPCTNKVRNQSRNKARQQRRDALAIRGSETASSPAEATSGRREPRRVQRRITSACVSNPRRDDGALRHPSGRLGRMQVQRVASCPALSKDTTRPKPIRPNPMNPNLIVIAFPSCPVVDGQLSLAPIKSMPTRCAFCGQPHASSILRMQEGDRGPPPAPVDEIAVAISAKSSCVRCSVAASIQPST